MSLVKATIYVPDDQWEAAKQLGPPGANPSRLVQNALSEWVGLKTPARFEAFDPTIDDPLFDTLMDETQRLRWQAQGEFDRGYAAGVELAKHLNWLELEDLAEVDFDVRTWVEPYRTAAEQMIADDRDHERALMKLVRHFRGFPAMRDALGSIVDPTATSVPRATFLRGFRAALKSLYRAATSPDTVTSSQGVDGVFEKGGKILHRKKGIGVIEDMRHSLEQDLEMLVRFGDGSRQRIGRRDSNVVALPPASERELEARPVADVFNELSARRTAGRHDLARQVQRFLHEGKETAGDPQDGVDH